MVQVILRRDVADLGRAGELVNVRPGYARNYLVPQGIALVATEGNRAGSRKSGVRSNSPPSVSAKPPGSWRANSKGEP